ncbi:response regulator [Paenibacillus sp. VCA1]|uniref:response regulator transcription factor n=1 Tax=Paenibacillus sp. VCA1 TaxID=3039148 RepID=UPI002870D37E|nr:helix-turn-helix domain-containing protein [Paenibacillus sp. VCA1]MDR9856931.1 response regulator [Paenibacillus sp. VCA1]
MTNVLVVDDDHLVRKGFIGIMPWQKYGFTVAGEAGNGEKALELLKTTEVDLLITDLAMPVMSGLELMREVKDKYPRICMVVLTFHHDFALIQEALRLGAVDYITKIELEQEQLDGILSRIAGRIREVKGGNFAESEASLAENREAASGSSYSEEVRECIVHAVGYIREHYQTELLLPDVAQRVNMSRSYFSRCFKDIVGQTFHEYVRELRIEHAKTLLRQTNKPVQWISVQSGYPNEKYFFKVFRETTGYLPGEFRKKARDESGKGTFAKKL